MIKKLFILLTFPTIVAAQQPPDINREALYISRVARNPSSELRFLQRRTANPDILNPSYGKGWAHSPKFGNEIFNPNFQYVHSEAKPNKINYRLSWSWHMEHFNNGTDPNSRVSIGRTIRE